MSLRSQINVAVQPAAPGEFAPLRLSEEISVWPPVVLAPMAGVTNPPYRSLCRRQGAGLYVAEMLHARGLAERDARTLGLASFGEDEAVRSIQIFGADPVAMAEATRFLVGELGIDHVDVNMGCPVRKVTSKGGGSALPARPALMAQCLGAVVKAAGDVPVTAKCRLGIDDECMTWRDAVAVCAGEGVRWLGVHARTAAQHYAGQARWAVLGEIKAASTIPILGNGDIWEAFDALRMMRSTGVDGVIIGRGCLGRPWLFRELADVFDGKEPAMPPTLGEVLDVLREHAELLAGFFGEARGMREVRKWCTWYTKGFPGSARVRAALQHVETLVDLEAGLAELDGSAAFPAAALRVSRGKRGGEQEKVSLPEGWLDLAAREQVDSRGGSREGSTPAAGEACSLDTSERPS
jgi:nifR3 family TIM-barrel protein